MLRSRLTRRIEQKTKRNLIFSILGIVLIIFLVFKFGVPLLINLSSFISGSRGKEETKIQNPLFIAPPILDSLPEATSSATIVVSGMALKNQTINVYVNDILTNTTKAGDEGKFLFNEKVKPGENNIKTKTVVNDKESDFSNILTIILKNAPPSLSISFPSDNQSFPKDQGAIEIRGSTDPDARVTVNGFWAIADSNGNFSYNFNLQNGENRIKVISTDEAGNKTEKELKVTYSS